MDKEEFGTPTEETTESNNDYENGGRNEKIVLEENISVTRFEKEGNLNEVVSTTDDIDDFRSDSKVMDCDKEEATSEMDSEAAERKYSSSHSPAGSGMDSDNLGISSTAQMEDNEEIGFDGPSSVCNDEAESCSLNSSVQQDEDLTEHAGSDLKSPMHDVVSSSIESPKRKEDYPFGDQVSASNDPGSHVTEQNENEKGPSSISISPKTSECEPMSPGSNPQSPSGAPLTPESPKNYADQPLSPEGGPASPGAVSPRAEDFSMLPDGGVHSPENAPLSPDVGCMSTENAPVTPEGAPMSPDNEGDRLGNSSRDASEEGPMSPDNFQNNDTQSDSNFVSNPQSPSEVSEDMDNERNQISNVEEDDEDSLDLTEDNFTGRAQEIGKDERQPGDIEPEEINSPESDMNNKQNIPSNAEDIDSPESDLEEEDGKYEKKGLSLESAASPISESDNESIGKEKGERDRNSDMYNDVSDEEDSFSDDDEGDNKTDSYKVDSAVKDVLISDKRESGAKVHVDSDSRKSESRMRKDSVTSVPSHAGLGEDVELDYDEDGTDDEHGKPQEDSKEKMDDSRGAENSDKDKKEDGEADSDKDDGELDDDEDCEEGEIREPGQRKPYVKPPCRFFMRGVCTWGSNCRFLHPGVNDKGNYRLIERPGGNNAPYGRGSGPWKGPDDPPSPKEEEEPEALPPPPPLPPQPETAWERGLRQAKEQLKKASQRKEMEPDFEQKRMNLSVEEEREFNKENDRQKIFKDPYYDQGYEDEYYDKPVHRSPSPIGWQPGQYENFEVRWNREPEWPPPPLQHYRERVPYAEKFHRKHFSPPPTQNYESAQRRHHHHHHHRETRRNNNTNWEGDRVPSQTHQEPVTRHKADTWHDPWRRSKSPKRKTRSSRSHSRGRRRSRRSHSYSSSFSSSSFSGSSRSRSSSYSSYSSRSSSRSSSSSRSPSKSKSPVKRPQGATRQKIAEPGKPGEKPRGSVTQKADKQKPMMKRQQSRPDGAPQPQQPRVPPVQRPKGPVAVAPPSVPPEANKDKGKDRQVAPQSSRPQRRRSSTRSRSRSSSSASSRSSRSSSFSSISSRSSSSSSGSADSEHLYRGVGSGREGAPISPKKKKGQKGVKPKEKMQEPTRGRPAVQQVKVPGQKQEARVTTAVQPTVKPKDPLKVTGQKPNIKLTLLANKPAPERQAPKKRPAGESEMVAAPPSKKPNVSTAQPSKPDKKLKKPEKPAQAKPAPAQSSKVTSNQPVTSPTKPVKVPPLGGAPAAAVATKEKKSTSSRREELLKQLKAVEDAIARKRSKMS